MKGTERRKGVTDRKSHSMRIRRNSSIVSGAVLVGVMSVADSKVAGENRDIVNDQVQSQAGEHHNRRS